MRRWIFPALLAVVALGYGVTTMAVEEPAFKTVLRDGDFELRDYPPLVVAEVTVTGDQRAAGGQGFRLLANYIFRGNRQSQGIAMTAPVALEAQGQSIAMTAPVTQTSSAGTWVVRFMMPAGRTLASLPQPNDERVKLRELPAAKMAVVRFSGWALQSDVAARNIDLLAWVASHKLATAGPVTLAQYNPPWTLWFMRRNEAMVPVNIEP